MTTAETLRSKATGLDARIRRCLGPPHHQDERTQHEGYVLTIVQAVLRKLAGAHDASGERID